MKPYPLLLLALLTGCQSVRHAVITQTGTGLGLEVAENPATGLYEAKLGYIRHEFAFVPSNRAGLSGETNNGNGAKDVADVIMELRFENILRGGGLYQRLAVGSTAVAQPGAALMFAKGRDGALEPDAVAAVTKAVASVPTTNADAVAKKATLAAAYQKAANKAPWDAAAQLKGASSFSAWLSDPATTPAQAAEMETTLRQNQLIP